ncbi:MAG TPA: glycerophosphodiester phosphodiesterase family protein [Pseudonocardia sp.]|nr:glycerophosphodiester phosphodiesterase family protein [Pseudonocardia sp.]
MPVSRPSGRPPTLHPYLDGPYPRAYAHRGWHLDELAGLENTTAAFRRAVDEGYAYLELDVHATADGVAVVHHDRALDRTTDAAGPLAARTAAELDRVRVRGPHRCEPIPHLRDVLAELPMTRVTVELKSGAAVRPVLAVLAELDAWDRVCLAGYHDPWLRMARRLARVHGAPLFTSMGHTAVVGLRMRGWTRRETARPGGRLRPPRVRAGRLASTARGDLAQLPHRFAGVTVVDADVLRVTHESGREVHVWTVDDPAEMGGLLDRGADGILSDRPDLLRDLLRSRGAWP